MADNQAPIAVADQGAVTVSGAVQATGNVLANDSDADGDALTVASVNGQAAQVGVAIRGVYGSLVLGADGNYQYVLANNQANVQALAPGQTVTDVFTYTVSDGSPHTVTTTTVSNENLIAQSEAFDSGAWVKFADSGALPTVTADVAVGPQGSARTADQLTLSGANNGIFYDTDVSGRYTFSVWIKLVSGDGRLQLNYYDGGETGFSTTVTATGSWQRFSYTFDGVGSPNANVALMHGGWQTGAGVFQVWGAQLNPGSAPSDYLPTAGSPAVVTTTTTTPVVVGSELDITVTGAASPAGSDNQAPIAVADQGAVTVNGAVQATGNVLANDSDADGDALTVASVNGQAAQVGVAIRGVYGSLVLGADGNYQYVLANNQANVQALAPGQTVTDVFTYTVSDGSPHTVTTTTVSNENLIAQSEAFDSGAWVKFADSGALPTVTADVAVGPQGSARTADQLTLSGANNGIFYDTDVSGRYTFSVWIKLVSGDGRLQLNYYDGGETGFSTTVTATGSWQRFSYTFDGVGSPNANVALMHGGWQTGAGVFQVWGAQLNPGSAASDYLPTAGSPAVVTTTTTTPVVVGSELDITVTGAAKPQPPQPLGDAVSVSLALPQASGNVLANDKAAGGGVLTVASVNGQAAQVGAAIQGLYGSLVLGADGHYQYVLASNQANVVALGPGQTVTDVFTYAVSDGISYSTSSSVISGQNFILQSEAFDNPLWVKFGSTTVAANVAAGPSATGATADQVTLKGAASGIYYGTPAQGQYTFSIWVKLVSGDGHFDLNYYDGANGHAQAFLATGAWQRYSITFNGTADTYANVAFMHDYGQTGTGAFQVWGAQLNPGAQMGDYAATTGHFDSAFATVPNAQPASGQLTVSVSGPDPAAGAAKTLDFSGGTQGVVVDLQARQWSHALKVLPLGDSITYGWTSLDYQLGQTNASDGYRGPLWWDFAANDMLVNFVGPNSSGDAALPDRSHAGFPNQRSDQIAALLPGVLQASHPDAILLMAGTNDLFQEVSPASHVADSLTAMIAQASRASASTHIYVATLMPINQALDGEPGDAAMVATVNQAIRAVVAQAAAAGLNVSLVDTGAITLSDIADAAHPTASGYAKLAQIWHDAIVAAQPPSGGTPGGDAHAVAGDVTTVTGSQDNDLLIASDLGSVLNGGGGADRLVAGRGSDVLTGGAGADQFVFASGAGHAVVTDFSHAQGDHLELDAFSNLSQFSQLSGHIGLSGGSTVIDLSAFGSPTTITLSQFSGSLTASDVWFG